jgi:hypothetical protein
MLQVNPHHTPAPTPAHCFDDALLRSCKSDVSEGSRIMVRSAVAAGYTLAENAAAGAIVFRDPEQNVIARIPLTSPFGLDVQALLDSDYPLLAACAAHQQAWPELEATKDAGESERLYRIVTGTERVATSMPARSVAGLLAKAVMMNTMLAGDDSRGDQGDDLDRLGASIVRDLVRIGVSDPEPDPILALLAEHRAAGDAWRETMARQNALPIDGPEYKALDKESDAAAAAEEAAWERVLAAKPTTVAGLKAFTAHVFAWKQATSVKGAQEPLDVADAAILAAVTEFAQPMSPEPDGTGDGYEMTSVRIPPGSIAVVDGRYVRFVSAADGEDPILGAIEAHRRMDAAFEAAAAEWDAAGEPASGEAKARFDRASDDLDRAGEALATLLPTTPAGAGALSPTHTRT